MFYSCSIQSASVAVAAASVAECPASVASTFDGLAGSVGQCGRSGAESDRLALQAVEVMRVAQFAQPIAQPFPVTFRQFSE